MAKGKIDYKQFDVDHQFTIYLQRVKLSHLSVVSVQYIELRRVFFAAYGQSIIMLRDELTKLPDEEADSQLEAILNQISNFFLKENNRIN